MVEYEGYMYQWDVSSLSRCRVLEVSWSDGDWSEIKVR